MSILVTGAAGFIGCNNVLALNERGITDVIAVDNLERGEKYQNVAVPPRSPKLFSIKALALTRWSTTVST